jgi:dipeptidyl aminopeptidase/acylaminoacyl peptidase
MKRMKAALWTAGLLAICGSFPKAARGQITVPPEREGVYRKMLDFKSLIKGGTVEPHWMADGRSFWYVEGAPANTVIQKMDPAANSVTPLFDTARLRSALAPVLGHEPPYQGLPFETFDFLDNEKAIRFMVEARAFRLELDSYKVTPTVVLKAPPPPEPPEGLGFFGPKEIPAPRGEWTAVSKESNLWLRSNIDNRSFPLTSDGVERFPWILSPACWSPDATRLLVTKQDWRDSHFMPVAHWLKANHQEITYAPYPPTGGILERTEVYVVDTISGERTRIDIGENPEQHIYLIGWRPSGSEVLLMRLDRLMKHLDLLVADAKTGHSRVLLSEFQKTFIEALAFDPKNILYPFTDGSRFVWRSERDGWSNLFLYDSNGNLLHRLTSGETPVESVDTIDEKGGWVYYLASGDRKRPYDVQLYRVDLEGKHSARLTEETGVHSPEVFAPGKEYFLDTHSTVDRPPLVVLRKADGTKVRDLSAADTSGLKSLHWRVPEEFHVKAADGQTDLYGVLYKPYDFDSSKRYPVIDLQYMGNFVHWTPRAFAGSWLGDDAQSLTQLGFIVFIVDGRGTTGRGKAFQDFTYNGIGKIEIPDHAATLKQLAAERTYMDTSRVGITGYSWGGYYTLRALLTAPDVFQVGVSGAPIVDFAAARSPIEPYMGLPQDNVEGYEQGSLVKLADKLKGKLLIAIGTSDVNVTFEHTMRLANAFIKANKHFDLIVMPEETHALTPSAMAYYTEARNQYFVEHLKP